MKKQFVKVLSLLMALTMVLGAFGSVAVSAQGAEHDHSNEEHECVWGEIVVEELTCDVNGNIVDGCIYRECTVDGCDKRQDVEVSLKDAIDKYLDVDCREHAAYTYNVAKAPDCENDGEATYTCSVCGKGYGNGETKIPVKALGHDYEYETIKEETCTENGLRLVTCSRCDYSNTVVIDLISGHNYVSIDTTKLATGNCTGECVLGIPANESVYEASTCCTKGYQYKHCSRCDELSEKIELPLEDHKFETETFTKLETVAKFAIYVYDDGQRVKAGDYTAEEIVKNFIVVGTPTKTSITIVKEYVEGDVACTTSQLRYKKCTVCGWKVQINKDCDLAHGHKWEDKSDWEEILPSCVAGTPGYSIRECTVCGETSQVNYTPWAHTMNRYSCTEGCASGACADCTHEGRYVECSVCYATNDTKTAVTVYEDHNWVKASETPTTPATCTKPAVYSWKCTNIACGATDKPVKTDGDPNPKNHGDLQQAEIVDPTCGAEGSIEGYCNECQTYVNDTIPKVTDKHTGKKIDKQAQASTCMTPGWTEGWHCDDCGASQESTALPLDKTAAGHAAAGCTKTAVLTVDANCISGGGTVYYWSECKTKDYSELKLNVKNPNNHYRNNIEWDETVDPPVATNTPVPTTKTVVDAVAPTCTVDGYHGYTYCDGCGVITAIDTTSCAALGCGLDAAGHLDLVEDYVGTSHTVNGKDGTSNALKINMLGHHWYTAKNAKHETCLAPGNVAEIYCDRACCTGLETGKVYKEVNGVLQNGATIKPHGISENPAIFWENKTPVDPTCTQPGKAVGKFCTKCAGVKCDVCEGATDVVPALGHTLYQTTVIDGDVSYVVVKCANADCFDQLKGDSKVKNNGIAPYGNYIWYAKNYTVAAPVVNNCEHENTTDNTTGATCTVAGEIVTTCDDCGEVVATVEIPAKGHRNADDNVIYLDCQSYTDYVGQTCLDCGYTAGDHIYHNLTFVRTGATCELAEDAHTGELYYECSDCGVKVDYVWYEAFGMGVYGLDYGFLPATGFMAPGVTEAMSEAKYVSTVSFTPATSTAAGTWVWNCVCGDKHTTTLAFEYGMTFDLTVAPYTTSEIESELNFVNGGLIEVVISATAEDVAVKALSYKLGYNSALLSFVGAELVYEGDFETPIVGDNDGNVTILTTPKTGVDSVVITGESVPMFKYIFRLSEGATSIPADTFTLYDPEFDSSVKVTVVNNNLAEAIDVDVMGDLTGDDLVTIDDLVAFRALINANGYNVAADFNNDGWVDFMDLIAINNFLVSNKTVADYYKLLGTDLNAAIAAYDYSDCDGDGDADIADLNEFKAEINNILATNSDYTYILGANNLNTIFATAAANAKVNP